MRTAIASNVWTPWRSVERWRDNLFYCRQTTCKQWNLVPFFATGALCNACAVSVTHRTTCRAAFVWTTVQSVYGQPKSQKQKRKYISGIAAITAGQIQAFLSFMRWYLGWYTFHKIYLWYFETTGFLYSLAQRSVKKTDFDSYYLENRRDTVNVCMKCQYESHVAYR